MKKHFALICAVFLVNNVALGQFVTKDRNTYFLFSYYSACEFITYDTTKTRFYMPKSEKEVDYSTMAGVALSRVYATNYEWNRGIFEDSTEYAFFGIKKEKFEAIKTLKPKENYIVPVLEYHYTVDKEEAGVFFGVAHTSGDRVFPVIMAGVKKEGRWFSSNRLMSSPFEIFFISFKPQILARIMRSKPIGEPRFDEFLERILTNDYVDIDKLHREYNRIQNEKGDDFNYFIDDMGKENFKEKEAINAQKINSGVKISLQFEGKKDSYSNKKQLQIDFNHPYYKNHLAERAVFEYENITEEDTLYFNFKKSFYYHGKPIAIIKYQKNGINKAAEIEMVNGKAKVVNNPRFENIRYVIKVLKTTEVSNFESFLREGIDEDYKIDGYYIPSYQIDYDTMAEILRDKPASFAPFCDYD